MRFEVFGVHRLSQCCLQLVGQFFNIRFAENEAGGHDYDPTVQVKAVRRAGSFDDFPIYRFSNLLCVIV